MYSRLTLNLPCNQDGLEPLILLLSVTTAQAHALISGLMWS